MREVFDPKRGEREEKLVGEKRHLYLGETVKGGKQSRKGNPVNVIARNSMETCLFQATRKATLQSVVLSF